MISNDTTQKKIAVVMTCFNRKEKTLRSLQTLSLIPEKVEVYLVNDGCTDGTPNAVEMQYPQVHLIQGNGKLYWNRGMHLAWSTALAGDYDYYLWLNDDVALYPDALTHLLADSQKKADRTILSGAVKDPQTDKLSYGGINQSTGKQAAPDGTLQPIRNLNGNVLLVPRYVVQRIGIIDPVYEHHFGDVDYGLTAKENDVEVLLGSHYAGECVANSMDRNRKRGVSLAQRFSFLYSPFGSPPRSIFHFFRKHKNIFYASASVVYLHAINLMPDGLFDLIFPHRQKL